MPRITLTPVSSPAELDLAMLIWAAAQRTRPRPPSPDRLRRVRERVADGPLVLLAHYGDRPAGMVVAEEYHGERVDHAPAGVPEHGSGHIATVAVDPAVWGSGIGSALVVAAQQRWSWLSVWVRADHRRAERLFAGRGFIDVGNISRLQDGEEIRQWLWASEVSEPDQTRKSVMVEPFGTFDPLPGLVEETYPSPR